MSNDIVNDNLNVRKYIQKVIIWIFSKENYEKEYKDEKERFENTMKVTSICRYNASVRLKWESKIAFITTTLLSLGLIFIPLIQIAKIPLVFSSDIFSVVQIFLAISVLVYSTIIANSKYDLRSDQLKDCGDKIKSLIRKLRLSNNDENLINEIKEKYDYIATSVENHDRNDYLLTMLRTKELYKITGIIRIFLWFKYFFLAAIFNMAPFILLSIEIIFILDMFNITRIFTPYLLGEYVKGI